MNIISFKELNSTNTYVKQHISELEDRTIVSTDVQTNGYGRFERNWVDLGEENIYMTFALKPQNVTLNSFQGRIGEQPCDAETSSARREGAILEVYANLTQYLSVCLCKQLEYMTPHPQPLSPKERGESHRLCTPLIQIKWPNDVLINGKKVCGILAESVIRGGKLKGIALGIGINLNASTDDLGKIDRPATSLNLELGRNIPKQEFMENLINRFFDGYDEFLENGFESIKEFYDEKTLFTKGETLKIAVFNKVKEGRFIGFDNNGNLLINSIDNLPESINMGEII